MLKFKELDKVRNQVKALLSGNLKSLGKYEKIDNNDNNAPKSPKEFGNEQNNGLLQELGRREQDSNELNQQRQALNRIEENK